MSRRSTTIPVFKVNHGSEAHCGSANNTSNNTRGHLWTPDMWLKALWRGCCTLRDVRHHNQHQSATPLTGKHLHLVSARARGWSEESTADLIFLSLPITAAMMSVVIPLNNPSTVGRDQVWAPFVCTGVRVAH
eukprot:8047516-Pyramimonas_sp.AAC.1